MFRTRCFGDGSIGRYSVMWDLGQKGLIVGIRLQVSEGRARNVYRLGFRLKG